MKSQEDQKPIIDIRVDTEEIKRRLFDGANVNSLEDLGLWIRAKTTQLIRDVRSGDYFREDN